MADTSCNFFLYFAGSDETDHLEIVEDDDQLEEMENTDPIYDNNDAAANFPQNLVR